MKKLPYTFDEKDVADDSKVFDSEYLLVFGRFFLTRERADLHRVFGMEKNGKLTLFGEFESLAKATKFYEGLRERLEKLQQEKKEKLNG